MSLISDIGDLLKDLPPNELEKIKSVATTVVTDLADVNEGIAALLKVVPPSVLHIPPEVTQFESEFTAVVAVVQAALATLP